MVGIEPTWSAFNAQLGYQQPTLQYPLEQPYQPHDGRASPATLQISHLSTPSTVLRSWRPGFSEVATSRRGDNVLIALRLKDGHRVPADPCPCPEIGARDVAIRQYEYRYHRAVFVHRGPAYAAPLRQSKLLESIQMAARPSVSLQSAAGRLAKCAAFTGRTPGSTSHLLWGQ